MVELEHLVARSVQVVPLVNFARISFEVVPVLLIIPKPTFIGSKGPWLSFHCSLCLYEVPIIFNLNY